MIKVSVGPTSRTPDGRGYWILFWNAAAAYGDAGSIGPRPVGHFGELNPAAARLNFVISH
jgi:hypothetical protein